MSTTTGSRWLGLGALVAAIGASICCVLPVAAAVAGIGSAAFGAVFEPYRPYMVAATILLLGFGFYRAYRPLPACAPSETCAVPESRRRQRLMLWVVAVLALLLLTFPYYIGWLL